MVATLAVKYDDIRRALGLMCGYGRDPDNDWSTDEVADGAAIIADGLRRFYAPEPLPGKEFGHDWSFLRPRTTLDTVSDTYDYPLPDDFTMLDGQMTFDPSESVMFDPIEILPEHIVRLKRADATHTGRPLIAAIYPRVLDGVVAGTRWNIEFWPTPDDSYTIHYRYRVAPNTLDATNQYPLGGDVHGNTVKEAILAAAEHALNDTSGVHEARYLAALKASISHDRKAAAPDTVGRNLPQVSRRDQRDWHDLDQNIVTYEGVEY